MNKSHWLLLLQIAFINKPCNGKELEQLTYRGFLYTRLLRLTEIGYIDRFPDTNGRTTWQINDEGMHALKKKMRIDD